MKEKNLVIYNRVNYVKYLYYIICRKCLEK